MDDPSNRGKNYTVLQWCPNTNGLTIGNYLLSACSTVVWDISPTLCPGVMLLSMGRDWAWKIGENQLAQDLFSFFLSRSSYFTTSFSTFYNAIILYRNIIIKF
jgi:hypothetical protein